MGKKEQILDLYKVNNLSCIEISKKLGITKQAVSKVLIRNCNEYRDRYNKQKEEIKNMFYIDKLKVKEIANKLNIKESSVTRIIKEESEKYSEEKLARKQINKEKHARQTAEINRKKRLESIKEDGVLLSQLKELQKQNAISMSRKRKISEDQIIEMNLQHYDYNKEKGTLVYNGRVGLCPKGMPRSKKVANRVSLYISDKNISY